MIEIAERLMREYEAMEQEYQKNINEYPINKKTILTKMLEFLVKNLPKIPKDSEGIYFVDPSFNLDITYRLQADGILRKELSPDISKRSEFDRLDLSKPEVKANFLRDSPELVPKLFKAYIKQLKEREET